MQTFDYLIVGAGAAGCVLAYRLSQDPNVSVALLEAGGSDRHPFIDMPKGLPKAMTDPKLIWNYRAEPEQGNAFSNAETWARGRVLGGSSSINGMMYVRGQPADFDEIAAVSSDDWSWRHIGAAYAALESHELGADETRGASGPLKISLADRRSALTEAMIAAGESMGLKRREDVNAPSTDECVGYASRTIWRGKRQSAVRAFLDPIRQRPNLTVISNALVDKVEFDQRRATGVSYIDSRSGTRSVIHAAREVILAGGAMASPGILQRSGIGPGELLQKLGIPVLHAAAGVGNNLLEHRCLMPQWKLREQLSDNREYSGWRLFANVARYYLTGTGPMTTAAFDLGAWLRSSPEVERPDIQFLMAPFSLDYDAGRTRLEAFPGMSIVANPLRPTSRGDIHIHSRDPAELPRLRPNYHSTEHDRHLMVTAIELARRWAAQPALARYIDAETWPGPARTSDEQILEAYDLHGSCGYHAVGTCRMGLDADSVVDPQLRVRGVEGLRVMDTSIMPQIPAGNTNGPTMAMAWRAADVIRASARTAPVSEAALA